MADRALSALLSLASHELRQPAGVIRGYLRLLDQDPALPERRRKAVHDAMRAADRLAGLLDEMGDLASLANDTTRLTPKSLSLRSVLTQAVQAATLPDDADIDLDVAAPTDVRLRADETRLRDVFATLIGAVARAQTGAATIELRLVKTPRGRHVTVLPRSLNGGKVVDRPLDMIRGGSGLRLPIADAIVQAHGGRLRERWIAGRWCGFVVRL